MDIDDLMDQTVKCQYCKEEIDISLEDCNEQDTLYPTIKCPGCGKIYDCYPRVIWEIQPVSDLYGQ